ncbi:hypothetical protein Gotri_015384 [Gossypium trilobum]|uniref:MAR-binding filament-like protein 1 n=1 Tax=Gossypium trilobum TaxID=34281 RepID=A0A7J9E062_9ROSI|nr:hypothetical protein [Gossypium trilobum]
MATTPLSSHFSPLPSFSSSQSRSFPKPLLFPSSFPSSNFRKLRKTPLLVLSSNNFDAFPSRDTSGSNPISSKKSVLNVLIQDIEPLDVSLIHKDVPPTTVDAMKRTISGMFGLLPSDRFQVYIEAMWEPLSKLLVSSMMTGYTLRNAEYRLCLERNLGCDTDLEHQSSEKPNFDLQEIVLDGTKELHELKKKNEAMQMQQFVGEEKNDLLDYLRSLQPEKVVELSEPSSPELKETIHSVVHGILATLSPRMHSKVPLSENTATGTVNIGSENCSEPVEDTSLQLQPLISLTRDYLARLLFWCMLLGHYLRGLEYRQELMELLSLTSSVNNNDCGGDQ